MYYETDDNLTKVQANKFIASMSKEIGVDYELNESASGELDQYYVLVCDLEWDNEVETCRKLEKECLL